MNQSSRFLMKLAIFSVAFGLCGIPSSGRVVQAENKIPIGKRVHTELSVDLLLPRTQGNPLAGQKWATVFRDLGVYVRVRQRKGNDTVGVEQFIYGTIRRVKVTGQIDRAGNIVLPERTFRPGDTEKLKEWIKELQLYGAQGAPEGQPLWGLKKAAFKKLYDELAKTVGRNTSGLSLTESIRLLELPEEYPLRFTAATREHLSSLQEQQKLLPVKHDLRQFAKGTALAMILRGYSLSFSPRRMPDESIELDIEPYDHSKKSWPIGWDPAPLGLKRLSLAKKMYQATVIEIHDLPVSKLIPKVRSETELDVFIDPLAISEAGLNLDQLIVNFPRKRTSWSLCLRTVLAQVKLVQKLRVDENNRPFIWVTQFQPQVKKKEL